MNDPLEQIRLAGQANKNNDSDKAEKQLLEDSSNRLMRIIETKVRTSFIGAIAQFEQLIGVELWGHGKNEKDLDEDELSWLKTWQRIRTIILNNGNAQIRALQSEIGHYDIKWNRYQLKGVMTPGGNDNAYQK